MAVSRLFVKALIGPSVQDCSSLCEEKICIFELSLRGLKIVVQVLFALDVTCSRIARINEFDEKARIQRPNRTIKFGIRNASLIARCRNVIREYMVEFVTCKFAMSAVIEYNLFYHLTLVTIN